MKNLSSLRLSEELPIRNRHKFKRKSPLTVCIAAICDGTTIFGASDRMMTAGDIEFEPDLDKLPPPAADDPLRPTRCRNTKIWPLTRSIAALSAGDSGLQCDLFHVLHPKLARLLQGSPPPWIPVSVAADLYVEAYDEIRAKYMQSTVFSKYGLDADSFIARQHEMTPQFIAGIEDNILRFRHDFFAERGVETIFAGIDDSTGPPVPHIVSVYKSLSGDLVVNADGVGFASVGSGSRHAESQFMMAGHSRYSSMPETLLLTYVAKKRSEVAPGVGKGTDMFVLGPQLGQFWMLPAITDLKMDKIHSIYAKMEKEQAVAFDKARSSTKIYIQNIFKRRAAAQKPKAGDGTPPTSSPTEQQQPSSQSPPVE